MNAATETNAQTAEPILTLHASARVSESSRLHFETTSLDELSRVLAFFNLVPPPVANTPEPAAGNASSGGRKPSKSPAAPSPAPTPAATAPAAAGTQQAPAQEPAASASSVTPEQAAAAVKAYGAKNGIDAARKLLADAGITKTGEITAALAPSIHAAATAAASADEL